MAAFAVVLGAGAAQADDPWPDPFNPKVKTADTAVVSLTDSVPDRF